MDGQQNRTSRRGFLQALSSYGLTRYTGPIGLGIGYAGTDYLSEQAGDKIQDELARRVDDIEGGVRAAHGRTSPFDIPFRLDHVRTQAPYIGGWPMRDWAWETAVAAEDLFEDGIEGMEREEAAERVKESMYISASYAADSVLACRDGGALDSGIRELWAVVYNDKPRVDPYSRTRPGAKLSMDVEVVEDVFGGYEGETPPRPGSAPYEAFEEYFDPDDLTLSEDVWRRY